MTEYLEASVKAYNISHLQTGDLVKMEAEVFPIIFHWGVIERTSEGVYIYHIQPDLINKKGGSLIREEFKRYIGGKKIVSIEHTDISSHDISEIAETLSDKKYDFINNNCEHFINKIRNNKWVSPQAGKFGIGLILVISLILYVNRKK
jgi:hypothetical protein